MAKYSVIIPASGYSSRFKYPVDKIFYKIKNELVIKHTVNAFLYDDECNKIILTANEQTFSKLKQMFSLYSKVLVVYGGHTRNETIRKSVNYLDKNNQYVLIHDGARPYISSEVIEEVKCKLFSDEYDAITTYIDIYDSLIKINDKQIDYVNRDEFKLIQTPQAFKQNILIKALNQFNETTYNDEFSLVKQLNNIKTKLVPGSRTNIKITTIDDVPPEF